MATFEYVDIPDNALRLKHASLEPAIKIFTALPDVEPVRPITEPLSPAKAALALVPQMLLSASIPPMSSTVAPPSQPHSLLTTRDPLSVPIITANFRRFIARVGPYFWLQDRIEEILFWKKGWRRTTVWLAAYAFFCYYPRMALLIPHIVLLAVMLYYYPDPGAPPAQINVADSSADWQTNIQAIQNLMGAFSDLHDAIVPLLPLLLPPPPKSQSKLSTPTHEPTSYPIQKHPRRTSDAPCPTTAQPATQPHHPLLIATLLSFLLLLPFLMIDLLPFRLLFFLAGAGTVVALHPRIKDPLSSTLLTALSGTGPGLSFQLSLLIPRLLNPLFLLPAFTLPPRTRTFTFTFCRTLAPRDVYLFFRRLIDDDKLDDTVWRAPRARVELWENERWVQDAGETKRRRSIVTFVREEEEEVREEDTASTTSNASNATVGPVDTGKAPASGGMWSKANLKPNERVGWTRGRDGWCGVGGEVNSNLTFSLSPGWTFVETEGWRADLSGAWAVEGDVPCNTSVCVGADEDGWAYTTDTWTHPRPDGRPSEGWVTRRRRWVRRVYYSGVEG